jgi:hypothetical protein
MAIYDPNDPKLARYRMSRLTHEEVNYIRHALKDFEEPGIKVQVASYQGSHPNDPEKALVYAARDSVMTQYIMDILDGDAYGLEENTAHFIQSQSDDLEDLIHVQETFNRHMAEELKKAFTRIREYEEVTNQTAEELREEISTLHKQIDQMDQELKARDLPPWRFFDPKDNPVHNHLMVYLNADAITGDNDYLEDLEECLRYFEKGDTIGVDETHLRDIIQPLAALGVNSINLESFLMWIEDSYGEGSKDSFKYIV